MPLLPNSARRRSTTELSWSPSIHSNTWRKIDWNSRQIERVQGEIGIIEKERERDWNRDERDWNDTGLLPLTPILAGNQNGIKHFRDWNSTERDWNGTEKDWNNTQREIGIVQREIGIVKRERLE